MNSQVLVFAVFLAGSMFVVWADEPKPKKEDAEIPESMKAYADKFLQIAKTYPSFGRVDDEARWAPYLCRMPFPARARFSDSKDNETHGQKLYSLFAKDRSAYVRSDPMWALKPTPVGQIIVKESWTAMETKVQGAPKPERVPPIVGQDPSHRSSDHFVPFAHKDGKWYKASKFAGIYIMMKVDPNDAATDRGWIYGTVSDDLKRVTSIGKVASCMECHQKANYDRQFGIPSNR